MGGIAIASTLLEKPLHQQCVQPRRGFDIRILQTVIYLQCKEEFKSARRDERAIHFCGLDRLNVCLKRANHCISNGSSLAEGSTYESYKLVLINNVKEEFISARRGSRTLTPIRTHGPQPCLSTNSSIRAECGLQNY